MRGFVSVALVRTVIAPRLAQWETIMADILAVNNVGTAKAQGLAHIQRATEMWE